MRIRCSCATPSRRILLNPCCFMLHEIAINKIHKGFGRFMRYDSDTIPGLRYITYDAFCYTFVFDKISLWSSIILSLFSYPYADVNNHHFKIRDSLFFYKAVVTSRLSYVSVNNDFHFNCRTNITLCFKVIKRLLGNLSFYC